MFRALALCHSEWRNCDYCLLRLVCNNEYQHCYSLHSSLFHFLLAGESESQGEVVQTHGARAKRGTGGAPSRALTRLPLG